MQSITNLTHTQNDCEHCKSAVDYAVVTVIAQLNNAGKVWKKIFIGRCESVSLESDCASMHIN